MSDTLAVVAEITKQVETLKTLSLLGVVLAAIMVGISIQKMIGGPKNNKRVI